jgi:hypothetical protein
LLGFSHFCRYSDLIELAKNEYGSVHNMAIVWEKKIKKRACQQRSIFVSEIKKLWLGNNSPFAIATNCLTTDLNINPGDVKLNDAIIASGLQTVGAVRKCLKSNAMYRNAAMYHLICGGIESGKVKRLGPKQNQTTISSLMTIAHEANIRMELHYNLKTQRSRHHPSTDHGLERTETWHVFMNLVYEDRKNNEKQATLDRAGRGGDDGLVNPSGSDSEDDAEPLDPKFYNEIL